MSLCIEGMSLFCFFMHIAKNHTRRATASDTMSVAEGQSLSLQSASCKTDSIIISYWSPIKCLNLFSCDFFFTSNLKKFVALAAVVCSMVTISDGLRQAGLRRASNYYELVVFLKRNKSSMYSLLCTLFVSSARGIVAPFVALAWLIIVCLSSFGDKEWTRS